MKWKFRLGSVDNEEEEEKKEMKKTMTIIKLKNDMRQVIRTTTTEKTGQEDGGKNNNDEFNKLSFWDLNVIKHHSVVELICSRYLVYYLVPLSSCSSTAP